MVLPWFEYVPFANKDNKKKYTVYNPYFVYKLIVLF